MKPCIRVTAAVIIQQGKVLITQRHADDEMGNKWEFPGGKIEDEETPEDCLQRELQEELCIIADIHESFTVSRHTYPTFHIELLAYRATIRSGELELSVHQDLCWVPLSKLTEFDFSEADRPIVKRLLSTRNVQDLLN